MEYESQKIDVLNSIKGNSDSNSFEIYKNGNEINIYNNYNFVFIFNDDYFLILYEQHNPNINNSKLADNSGNQEEVDSKLNKKILKLKLKLIPIYKSEIENSKNLLPQEGIIRDINNDNEKNDFNFNIENENNNLNFKKDLKKIPKKFFEDNLNFKSSYDGNDRDSIPDEKISSLSSSILFTGNVVKYKSENISPKIDDFSSLDYDFSKELFNENTNNNEIFDNSFNFEQSIEELRNYINLVGISLFE